MNRNGVRLGGVALDEVGLVGTRWKTKYSVRR